MTNEITYLPLDVFRYQSQLEHLTQLANRPGCWEYATQRSRELANKEPDVYRTLPADLWKNLKEK